MYPILCYRHNNKPTSSQQNITLFYYVTFRCDVMCHVYVYTWINVYASIAQNRLIHDMLWNAFPCQIMRKCDFRDVSQAFSDVFWSQSSAYYLTPLRGDVPWKCAKALYFHYKTTLCHFLPYNWVPVPVRMRRWNRRLHIKIPLCMP